VREQRRTDAMKRPNAPPNAKPMTPETAVLPGQDSISSFICIEPVSIIHCLSSFHIHVPNNPIPQSLPQHWIFNPPLLSGPRSDEEMGR
jgi:hypothetical protein